MGAARTGTHLVNSIICETGETTPLLPEAHMLTDLAETAKSMVSYSERYPDSYFNGAEDAVRAGAAPLRQIVETVRSRYGVNKVVFRAPALSLNAPVLLDMFRELNEAFRFVVMIRDPRDAITSMIRWNERRIERGGKSMCGDDGDMLEYGITWFWSQYKNIVPIKDEREMLVVRYEDLVQNPVPETSRIYEELGLDVAKYGGLAEWRNVKADLARDGMHGDCITDLYLQPVSNASVGSYKEVLSAEEASKIFSRLKAFRTAFYPEL